MATLLNGVNEVLKRNGLIQGDSGLLTTLTDSPRQVYIDLAVQLWNEVVEHLYTRSGKSMPSEMAESTITLVDGTRSYALAAGLIELHWPLHNRVEGEYIREWEGGYHSLEKSQPQPDQWTGLAYTAAISPIDGTLYLERIPTAAEDGRIYHYNYDKDISLSAAADTFPFGDDVFRALVPVVSEFWERKEERDFDGEMARISFGRAAGLLNKQPMRSSWLPR